MKVAIVGSGISGLAAAWGLCNYSDHEVHVFERNEYVGGHTHTIDYAKDTTSVPVDTGFIVFNYLTYPNFIQFLKTIGVSFMDSEMSFSVSRDKGAFEWAGSNLLTVFAQWQNLFRIKHWGMIYDIVKFNCVSTEILKWDLSDSRREWTLGQYLEWRGFGSEFIYNYLLPMTAAIWSTPPNKCALDFPALTLIRFMHNHCLLQIADRPQWLTIRNGSRSYIDKILPTIKNMHEATPVTRVKRSEQGTTLYDAEGKSLGTFDHVVFASHADETLAILGEEASKEEKEVLGGMTFSENEVYVHSDLVGMPKRRLAWTSWNYLSTSVPSATKSGTPNAIEDAISLTYWMNNLQRYIPTKDVGDVFVTMNPPPHLIPAAKKTFARYTYTHPTFTPHLIHSQPLFRLPVPKGSASLQGKHNTLFAGAWTGYGFHEDGFTSGAQVAVQLGAKLPFAIRDIRYDDGTRPEPPVGAVTRFVMYVAQHYWYGQMEHALGICLYMLVSFLGVIGLVKSKKA